MISWAFVLILLLTIFYPYLEMEVMLFILRLKHWKYQTHASILLKQSENYIKKSLILIKLEDVKGADKMIKEVSALMTKTRTIREAFENELQTFRNKYIH